jgi:hypothetical protein
MNYGAWPRQRGQFSRISSAIKPSMMIARLDCGGQLMGQIWA